MMMHACRDCVLAVLVWLTTSMIAVGQGPAISVIPYSSQQKDAQQLASLMEPLLADVAGVELILDAAKNRILISGPDEVHAMVGRMIAELDRPPTSRAQEATRQIQTYRVPAEHQESLIHHLQGAFPTDVAVSADADRGLVFISARPSVHATIEQIVSSSGGTAARSAGPASELVSRPQPVPRDQRSASQRQRASSPDPSPATPRQPDGRFVESLGSNAARFVRVPGNRLPRVREQVLAIFSQRLQVQAIGDRRIFVLPLDEEGARTVEFEFDLTRGGVLVGGPDPLVAQLIRLLESLASESPESGYRTQVFGLRKENQSKLQELIEQGSALSRPTAGSAVQQAGARVFGKTGPRSPVGRARAIDSAIDPAAGNGVAWARYLFDDSQSNGQPRASQLLVAQQALPQQPGPRQVDAPAIGEPRNVPPLPNRPQANPLQPIQQIPNQQGPNQQGPNLDAQPNALPGGPQFDGVEVEALPDLDVIIIRGRDQDLDQLAEIVEQLERISRQTQPEVQFYVFQYANGQAVAELIEQISPDLVSGRQGRVAVIPIVKPNALLLIGWGDAVAAVMQLLPKLDQPVNPQSQSAVFRLRYASVTSVQQTLQSFFAEREGLGPRVQLAADVRTNSLIVYASPRDLAEVEKLIADLDQPQGAAVNRARVFEIKNALAADVAETLQAAIEAAAGDGDRNAVLELQTFDATGQRILRSGTLQYVEITPNPRNNTLIISSPEENLELIAELIRQLDTPASQAKIKVFRIENGDASSLVQTLRSLVPSQQGASVGPQLPSAAAENSLAPLRFSVDVRSNSIIATGSEGDLRIVEALLLKLDQSTTLQRKTLVYRLKNSPAVDVAAAVNQYLVSRRQIENATPGEDNPFQEIEREVVVVPEPVANKLILAATPRYFEEISELIEKLDEQPPQVVIQVLIAEVLLNNTDEFGVELGIQDSVLFDRSLLGDLLTTTNSRQESTANGVVTVTEEIIQAATNIPGFAFNSIQPLGNSGSTNALSGSNVFGGQALSNFAVGRGNEQLGFGGLVLSASSRNVSVLLRALRESRRVDVLSRPQIRTLDNQPAFIQVGQRVPRIVASTINQNGQTNSVTLENVGLILGVTPRVSPDGNVVMEIDAEKSALGPEEDGIPVSSFDGTVIRSPRVDTTTAQATVSAANGETIVLGGLITESDFYVHRSVPFLGDIPVIEHFFRFDSTTKRRTELLIILTPHVIRSADDGERIRQSEMAKMSWCAADVFDLHGDIGFYPASESMGMTQEAPEVIYPDLDPTGSGEPLLPPMPADGSELDMPYEFETEQP